MRSITLMADSTGVRKVVHEVSYNNCTQPLTLHEVQLAFGHNARHGRRLDMGEGNDLRLTSGQCYERDVRPWALPHGPARPCPASPYRHGKPFPGRCASCGPNDSTPDRCGQKYEDRVATSSGAYYKMPNGIQPAHIARSEHRPNVGPLPVASNSHGTQRQIGCLQGPPPVGVP